jgi:hypothetical protein
MMDLPIVHHYRGKDVFVKFDWQKPNDEVPSAVHLITEGQVDGLGIGAIDLIGPWDDYPSALADAMAMAEQWINNQLP